MASALMAPARTEIVACETCGGAQREADGRTRGEHLLERLQQEHRQHGDSGVTISSVRCLWACKRSCAVMVRSQTRVGYVIADLEPSVSAARALLGYAALYARTEDGAVPYRSWPEELKGHFLCRIPRTQPLAEPMSDELDPLREEPSA